MMASGCSCPSTPLVWSAEETSLKLIEGGEASNALNIEVHSGDTGTRILKPLKSSGPVMALVDEVVWRKPLSQILSMTSRPAFLISPRTQAPRSPSIVFQTVG